MKPAVAELVKRIEQGEDLEAISLSLISPAEQGLLKCCAVVRTFDKDLVDNYFRRHVPDADEKSIPFSKLIGHSFVQRVPRTDGVYALQPIIQKQYYDAWWDADLPRSEVPGALRELSTSLLEHYRAMGDAGKLDYLAQQVFVDIEDACGFFEELYHEGDEAFDLARCRDIINVLTGRENVLGASFSKALNDKDRYLQSRSLWATEYYQTVSYYEREELSKELESFLTNSAKHDPAEKWILHLHAPGGMGKTMFVRWLISRRCIPEPYTIPCGRVDFDFVDRITASQHRWRLFLDMARDLEVQIPGNYFHSLISRFTEYELILYHSQAQQTTSATPAQLPPREKLEEEMLYLFGKALKDANLAKPIILILDTLEEVILYHPDDLLELVRQIRELREAVPEVLLILSGRYDLTESGPGLSPRLPQFGTEFGDLTQTIRVKPFAEHEALGFLQQKKGLTEDRPLKMVVERSEGNPFKLALFADILLDDPDITSDTIRNYPKADLLYLIERVLSRIPNKTLHWLLRYGVVPRKLTLSFVKEVMKKYLLLAVSGDASHDDPRRYRDLTKEVHTTVKEKKIFLTNIINSPQQDINVDEVWAELQKYASSYAWVTMEASDPNTILFHGDVVNPMRRWLEEEPVYKLLHQDAISYFENKAQADPQNWVKWMRNAVYHKFQLDGAEAAGYWHQLMASQENPSWRRELASEIIGSEYVDDNFKPRLLLGGHDIITVATLIEAYYELARACVEIARAENVPGNNQLWSDADYDLKKCEQLQSPLAKAVISPAAITAVRAAILTSQRRGDEAFEIIKEALKTQPNVRERLRLEVELASAFTSRGDYKAAILHWKESLVLAKHSGSSTKLIVEMQKNLARLYGYQLDLEASAYEFESALSSVSSDDSKTRTELLFELADVYFDMGQFSRGRKVIEEANSFDDSITFLNQRRYLNYTTKFFLASGEPRRALANYQLATGQVDVRTVAALGDSRDVPDEQRHIFDSLAIESQEQLGMLKAVLLEFEEARAALEIARSHWREIGNSDAAKRCMLRKADLWLKQAGDIGQARSVLDEASRLSIVAYDPEYYLDEELLDIEIWYFANEKDRWKSSLERLVRLGNEEEWRPEYLAKLMLGIGVWWLLPNSGKASNQFFADLFRVLREIEPPSARMLLLDPLSAYPACKKIDSQVAEDLVALFPLERDDDDFSINAPKVAELLRVLGRQEQALSLLEAAIESVPEDNTFALRRLILTHARTSSSKPSEIDLKSFVDKFLNEFKSYPTLCGSTLVELAELSFGTLSNSARVEMLYKAEDFLLPNPVRSQWLARLLALRGKLMIEYGRDQALDQVRGAITFYESLGNNLEVVNLNNFLARQSSPPPPAPPVSGGGGPGGKGLSFSEPVTEVSKIQDPVGGTIPALDTPPKITTVHVQENWTEAVTIKTTLPGEEVVTRSVPIDPESLLDELLAFDTYENYSFSFLRQMDDDWVSACRGLGTILLDEKQALQLQQSAGKDKERSALNLIIDALQLSAPPWELMVLPSHLKGPASTSPALSYFYRSLNPKVSSRFSDVRWLQSALSQLGKQRIFPDGSYGRQTQDAVSKFQREHGLPDHGFFDGKTRRTLKNVLHSESGRQRPRVLLLRPSIERQRATSRGHEVYGLSAEEFYKRERFIEVLIVEDPYVEKVEQHLADFEPDVVHIFPTMEESTSIGIYLDFGSRGTGVMPPSKARMKSSSGIRSQAASTGNVQFFTLSSLSDMMRKRQKQDRPRPLLILDVLEPPGTTDLFTQLFLRNAFAAQIYQSGCFESVIATGLTPAEMQNDMSRALCSALGSFESVGEIVNRLRLLVDVGSYTHLPDFRGVRGPLRDPSDRRYLSTVVATAATALFTQDPEM